MSDTFALDVMQWVEKVKEDRSKIIRGVVLDLSNSIIKLTPVGNPDLWQSKAPVGYVGGTARGNWFATIESPSTEFDKTSIFGKGGGKKTKDMLEVAAKNADGNKFYLTNNTPYIKRLEYQGHSSQAPVGMVRVSVLKFNEAIKRRVSEL